jgi:broad specificity phosphatase PhoE
MWKGSISDICVFCWAINGLVTSHALIMNEQKTRQATSSLGMGSNSLNSDGQKKSPRKQIAFIRHGRTYMNDFINGIHYGGPGFTDVFPDTQEYKDKYHDSPLGRTGELQVNTLNDRLQRLSKGDSSAATELSLSSENNSFLAELDLIVTSPLTRALQTMEKGVYPSVKSRDIPVVAVPHAAERIFLVADLGKTRRQLKAEYSYVDLDSGFPSHVGEDDFWHYVPTREEAENYVEWRPNGEGQVYACLGEPEHRFEQRMEKLCHWLESRPESTIAVVCHGGVILWFLGEIIDNCDLRVVDFEDLRNPKRLFEPPADQAAQIK